MDFCQVFFCFVQAALDPCHWEVESHGIDFDRWHALCRGGANKNRGRDERCLFSSGPFRVFFLDNSRKTHWKTPELSISTGFLLATLLPQFATPQAEKAGLVARVVPLGAEVEEVWMKSIHCLRFVTTWLWEISLLRSWFFFEFSFDSCQFSICRLRSRNLLKSF